MPTGSDGSRERARRIVNRWVALYREIEDGEVVMPCRGIKLAMALNGLEIEIMREIDLAERAAWCSATAAKNTG